MPKFLSDEWIRALQVDINQSEPYAKAAERWEGDFFFIITPEGSIMAVNYATTNFMMEEHTGAAVPLYSNEEGRGRVPVFIRQPEIFAITRDYLGIQ